MRIEIADPTGILTIKFGQWLIKQIQSEIAATVNSAKLEKWDKFFATTDEYKSIYSKPVTTKSILLAGLKSLVCDIGVGKLIIRFNSTLFVPGMNHVNLETTIKLINYGTVDVKGYPIFSDTFVRVADNINDYVSMYMEGW